MLLVDLTITIAYFSIPIQILWSLYSYPRLAAMPVRIMILLVLFAFFIFLCGAGHCMRAAGKADTEAFAWVNLFTAGISLLTALYLLPLVPSLMSTLDLTLQDLKVKEAETTASKRQLMTFMAFLCHEIRNPLFAITSNLTFLGDEPLSNEQEEALGAIDQSARLMLRLVNDVLDIGSLESGKLLLEEHSFNLRKLLEGVASSMRTQVQHRHGNAVRFQTHIADSVPTMVAADSTRVGQICYNILSNACKFTQQGTIDFRVTVESWDYAVQLGHVVVGGDKKDSQPSTHARSTGPSVASEITKAAGCLLEAAEEGRALTELTEDCHGEDHHELHDGVHKTVLRMEFADSGCGITPDRLVRIFEPYSQSKLSDYRIHGGTGLGLSIVASVAKLMGGTVSVSSKVDQGTTFVVYLPLHESHQPASCVALDIASIMNGRTSLPNTTQSEPDVEAIARQTPRSPGHKRTVSMPMENRNRTRPALLPVPTPAETKDTSVAMTPSQGTQTESPSSLKGTVLVVDDNKVNRKIIVKMLSKFELQSETACDGLEAVEWMRRSRNFTGDPAAPWFDMCLCDLSMPVMDGFEATRRIRQDLGLTDMPIIALTAAAIGEGRDKALDAGASEFCTKPILRDDLYAVCRRYFEGASQRS